jgi:hypothetical protein
MSVAGETSLWDAFELALDQVDLAHRFDRDVQAGRHRWDGSGEIEGVPVVIEVKPIPTAADVARLRRRTTRGQYLVVVARRVSKAVADELARADIGFFDARGRLRLWHRPLLVDTAVAATEEVGPRAPSRVRLETASALDVALAALAGTARHGVRATAALVDRAPGTVSKQLTALRAAGLVDEAGAPAVPDLFEAVVDVWHPHRIPLADLPRPGGGRVNERLQVGLDDPSRSGWVLADIGAAAAWGAPVVMSDGTPPDFYVPDSGVLALARSLLGSAEYGSHACTVAVAPSPYVCRQRYDRSNAFNSEFLAPSPVVAALDLAADPARGREMLERWSRDLSPEVHRVW